VRSGFPMSKHTLLKDRLLADELSRPVTCSSRAIALEDAQLVHDPGYLSKLQSGGCRRGTAAHRSSLVRGALAARTTHLRRYAACRAPRAARRVRQSRGGAHHAFPDHARFCLLNDVAIAIRKLCQENAVARAVIIDLDVHQGNGTAVIFANEPQIFTFPCMPSATIPREDAFDAGCAASRGTAMLNISSAEHAFADGWIVQAQTLRSICRVDVAQGDRFGKLALTETGFAARSAGASAVRQRRTPLCCCWRAAMPPRRRAPRSFMRTFFERRWQERNGL